MGVAWKSHATSHLTLLRRVCQQAMQFQRQGHKLFHWTGCATKNLETTTAQYNPTSNLEDEKKWLLFLWQKRTLRGSVI